MDVFEIQYSERKTFSSGAFYLQCSSFSSFLFKKE